MAGAGQPFDFQLHQPLGGKADHLPQYVRIRALLKQRVKRHHLIGHCGHPRWRLCCGDQTLPKIHNGRLAVDNRPAEAPPNITVASIDLSLDPGVSPLSNEGGRDFTAQTLTGLRRGAPRGLGENGVRNCNVKSRGFFSKTNVDGERIEIIGVKKLPIDWFYWRQPEEGNEEFSLFSEENTLFFQWHCLRADGVEVRISDVDRIFYSGESLNSEADQRDETRQRPVPRPMVGRPVKWDWEGAIIEVMKIANSIDGLPLGPGAQAEIERTMSAWFVKQKDEQPSEAEIRKRASRIMGVSRNNEG